jgi:predicted RNase H-like nuclease (RuvC/YqgF family)
MLSGTPHSPIETNIINNNNEDDAMSNDATMQAKYQEEFQQRVQLEANLKVKESELSDATMRVKTLEESIATMTAEKSEMEGKNTQLVTELDKLKVEMSEVAKQRQENDIEAFLNANAKKILPAQKDSFKLMLQSAMNTSEEQYKLAKESIEKMPEHTMFTGNVDTTGRAENDEVLVTVEEVMKVNWNEVDLLSNDGQAKFTKAVNVLMKADSNLTSEQAENKLMGGQ